MDVGIEVTRTEHAGGGRKRVHACCREAWETLGARYRGQLLQVIRSHLRSHRELERLLDPDDIQ
jgi:hypothetical protein